jgi:hypothetical protein
MNMKGRLLICFKFSVSLHKAWMASSLFNYIQWVVRHITYINGNSVAPVSELTRIHTYHAVPLPCRPAKGLDCVFPIWFTQCGRVWFAHALPFPYRSPAMPRKRPLKATAGERHGMCELASAVQRRYVGDLPAFGIVGEWQGRGRCV